MIIGGKFHENQELEKRVESNYAKYKTNTQEVTNRKTVSEKIKQERKIEDKIDE